MGPDNAPQQNPNTGATPPPTEPTPPPQQPGGPDTPPSDGSAPSGGKKPMTILWVVLVLAVVAGALAYFLL